jgi:hypothetical protein
MTNIEADSYACMAASYGQLGRDEDAQKIKLECATRGEVCLRTIEEWREFWGDYVQFREQAPLDHLFDGLDKAGSVKN